MKEILEYYQILILLLLFTVLRPKNINLSEQGKILGKQIKIK